MTYLPKPKEREGKITLSQKQRTSLLDALYSRQVGRCKACGCWMTREPGLMHTATLGHDKPQPMGCMKRDNPDNLNKAICWKCNFQQGSRRVD